jgi:integrase
MPTRIVCRSPRWSSRFLGVAKRRRIATICTCSRIIDTLACSIEPRRQRLCKGGLSFQFRAHDLRRTAASYMGEAGVDRFHIAHVLNHRSVTHSTVTAIYDRYRYDKEKRAALEKWAEVLFGIVDVKPAPTRAPARRATRANVYEFRRQARQRAQAAVH